MRGGRPARCTSDQNGRQPPGPVMTPIVPHLTDKEVALQPHRLPEEDKTNTGDQNILCSFKPLRMLATFICQREARSIGPSGDHWP